MVRGRAEVRTRKSNMIDTLTNSKATSKIIQGLNRNVLSKCVLSAAIGGE